MTNAALSDSMASAVRRRPVLSYFLLAFAISWGGIAMLVLPGGLPGTAAELDALFGPVFGVMLLGPLLSALTLTAALDGRTGILALLAGFAWWRVAAGYYALALLTVPLTALLILGPFSAVSSVFVPTLFGAGGGVPLLVTGLAIGLAAGLVEELGWTGFAAPRLLATRSVVATAILIGVPHGFWHLLAGYFWGDGASFGLLFIPYFVMAWVVTLTALRLLIVWLYQRTQSALIASLAHASYTGALVMLWPVGPSPAETALWTAVFAVVLLGVVAALIRWLPAGISTS